MPARIPLSYTVFPHRIASSAPHCTRPMMFGGCPGTVTAEGSGKVSTGACGGLMSTALMFCANGCSTLAGTYPSPGLAGALAGAPVVAAPTGRVTEICTVVVRPTNTGSVPRGTGESGPTPSIVSASYHGPHEPSVFLARTRAVVPVRSSAVTATIEN